MNSVYAKPRATVPLATTELGYEGETMATETHTCKNCGLPIAVYQGIYQRTRLWHHVVLTEQQEKLITACPNDLGEAEPLEAAMDDMYLKYLTDSTSRDLRDHLNRARNSGDETAALLIAEELLRRSVDSDDAKASA